MSVPPKSAPWAVEALILGVTASALIGCARPASASAWPAQPMPDYPPPPASAGSTQAPSSIADKPAPPSKEAQANGEGASPLASRYQSQKAQATLTGKATYYGDSLSGHKTANGERYNPRAFTAAHKKLPFGTVVRVTRVDNGRVTYVRINDRGPFGARDRIIDLSRAAAEDLEMIRAGVVPVRVEVVGKPDSS